MLTNQEQQINTDQSPRRLRGTGSSYLRLKVTCGCGERYETIQEGHDHCNRSGHTLTVSGEIRS